MLQAGANPNAPSGRTQNTPAHCAAHSRNHGVQPILHTLLDHGADFHIPNESGATVLDFMELYPKLFASVLARLRAADEAMALGSHLPAQAPERPFPRV